MFAKNKNKTLKIILIIVGSLALILAIYFIPPVKRRVDWNLYELRSKIFYFFNPPGENPFTPSQQDELDRIVQMTQTAMSGTATATVEPTITPTNFISPTPTQRLRQHLSPMKSDWTVWSTTIRILTTAARRTFPWRCPIGGGKAISMIQLVG